MYKILSNNVVIAKDFSDYKEAKTFVQYRRIKNCIIIKQWDTKDPFQY